MTTAPPVETTACYHCGESCTDEDIVAHGHHFCCNGCRMVYEIINEKGFCEYYDLSEKPGVSQKKKRADQFASLDNPEIAAKLIRFTEGDQSHVTFFLPQMHCASCIWLLEKLPQLHNGILTSRVNFLKKDIALSFDTTRISLRGVADLLAAVGYEPHISLDDISGKKKNGFNRKRLYKIGIAGFCFGNIMLMSFPEYLSDGVKEEALPAYVFSYINLGLSLPVLFYCASEFFTSALSGLRNRFLNIDAPIALAILITFVRSVYEIGTSTGSGYLDSMSGIVFFMLLGRFFQNRSHDTLTFTRDYKSYFPIGVTVIGEDGATTQLPVSDLREGQRIRLHGNEIVPADGILFFGEARIDYSFVTGESAPVRKAIGEILYAGGKQLSGIIEMEVIRPVSQSYITQLWNNSAFEKDKTAPDKSFIHAVSRYFTYVLFTITAAAALYWLLHDPSKVWDAVTTSLIVACPCALLLSATFTNAAMLARLSRAGFYFRNASVLEDVQKADTIVFDKTGTLTVQGQAEITFDGRQPEQPEAQLIRSLASQSSHPLSRMIAGFMPHSKLLRVKNFHEEPGRGSSGEIDGHSVQLGSAAFVNEGPATTAGTMVYVKIDGEIRGRFIIRSKYRDGVRDVIGSLRPRYNLALLSGDNNTEEKYLRSLLGDRAEIRFNQDPAQKLSYVRELQAAGHRVIMVGDGLNDAGALKQSDTGIAVTDNVNNFSPACDVIADGRSFTSLPGLLKYCRRQKAIIYGSFIISLVYNVVGVGLAVQAKMAPVIAAVLMPASSFSIILFTLGMSAAYARLLRR